MDTDVQEIEVTSSVAYRELSSALRVACDEYTAKENEDEAFTIFEGRDWKIRLSFKTS